MAPNDTDSVMANPLWQAVHTSTASSYRRLSTKLTDARSSYESVATDEIELIGRSNNGDNYHSFAHNGHWKRKAYLIRPKPFLKAVFDDVRRAPWLWLAKRWLPHLLPIGTFLGLIVLLAIMSLPGFVQDVYDNVCKPDGSFELSFDIYTPWKRNAIFAINMGYGSYSFGVAKLIDVVWDIVAGRGGQVLLAYFSYRTFTKALCRTMETASVSSQTFESLTLRNDTFFGILVLIKEFMKVGGARARFAMLCIILCALFILSVPTWLSAMTGYTADIVGFVNGTTGNLIRASDFYPTIYTIHDGERLGDPYTNDFQIAIPWYDSSYPFLDVTNNYACWNYATHNYTSAENEWSKQGHVECYMLWRVSWYTLQSGFLGLNDSETVFVYPNGSEKTLSSPSLNISASFALFPAYWYEYAHGSWYEFPYGINWNNPKTHSQTFNVSSPLFYHNGSKTLYNQTEYNKQGSCQQQGDVRYRWGFSFLLLYVFVIIFLVWIIGMYGLYLDAYLHSRLDVVQRHMGLERAVLDLSATMRKRVDNQDLDLEGNSKLKSLVKGHMTYRELPLESLPPPRWIKLREEWENFRFWPWAKEEKWWLAAMLLFDVFLILSWTEPHFARGWSRYFSAFPIFGVFLVLLAGRRFPGRWLLFVFWMLLFWACNIWWIIAKFDCYFDRYGDGLPLEIC